jgi:putative MATE family efflux protein
MKDNNLTEAPIKGLIRKMSVPVAIGFFFNTMFNVVDTYFGGRISTEALAALSLSFPVFFLLIIFDSGTSTGTTALLANIIGERNTDKAKKYVGQVLSFGVIVSVVVTVIGLLLSPSIFRLLGAEGEYLTMALSYMNVIFYGSIFFMMISVMNSVLQATGNTSPYRNFLIGGFFLNCILDPWFLYGGLGLPAMGLQGVALATVVVQFVGCIYIASEAVKTGLVTKETFRHLIPEWKAMKEILSQALPASLNMATIGIGIFVITYFISGFGKDAVAAYGIATRIEQISLLPTIGITIAALSIIGQNNGAKKPDRVRETYALCIRYGVYVMTLGAIIMFCVRRPLMALFTKNESVVAIGSHYLVFACFTFIAYALLFISVSALQGIKRPMYAIWIGLYRQIVAPALVFYILIKALHWGIDGVWWGVLGVTWSAAIITVMYAWYVLKNKLTT